MERFKNKIAFVTGASRGIGKAIAERFAAEGAKVALVSNSNEDLNETVNEFQALGYEVLPILTDVSDANQVESAVERTVQEWGRIDILANNAGIAWEEDFLEIKDDHWRKMLDVNLNGMFYTAQRVSRQMVKQGEGVIINMASTNGIVGEHKYAHYNASKGGIVLLTKTMALELGRHNIRVNSVCPGYIQTPMSEAIDDQEFVDEYIRTKISLSRVGKPEDVAGVYAFLASNDAAFITGTEIIVDGGQLAQ
ncbi:SDR family NAD(P)-dependent oxidoreductase [Lederbergia citrea]|uniref:SDR family oxidoreductase n=1 Tax=Lederbergia citrea TaxID=2833581 RepID=A0A942USG4_9BACI|nr:SDR family NAD(P)-dependent oxidoreductase [Lederbergia citrea]MBS4178730.1 SDR family oxidoreductase [Lederbergia citrea]MBS4205436.1 SDR family oxidoreductase [Lederbergia citrea]MBS4224246.1 SDR family oxidoreductase [Lederbergia citrea]